MMVRFRAIAASALVAGTAASALVLGPPFPARAEGRDPLADCDSRVQRHPRSAEAHRCFVSVARRDNRWAEAASRLESLRSADPGNAWARFALASLLAARAPARAETLYREAIEGLARAREPGTEARARLELAALLALAGRLEESGEEIDRAEALAQDLRDPALESEVTVAQAWRAFRKADYGEAERLLRSVEDQVTAGPHDATHASWLSAMGAVFWATARPREALSHYRRQAEVLRRDDDRFEMAAALANFALLSSFVTPEPWTDRDRERLEGLVEEAQRAAKASGNRRIEAKCHLYLAQLGQRAVEKRAHMRRALAIQAEDTGFSDRLLALRLLAESLTQHEPRDPAAGFRLLDDAESLARAAGDDQELARALVLRATLEWEAGRASDWSAVSRDRARAIAIEALDAIEALRDRQEDALVRARTFSPWAFVYRRTAGSFLWPPERTPSPEDVDRAFAVAERMRARVLLDQLDLARVTAGRPPEGPAAERRAQALDAIARLNRRLTNPSMPDAERRGSLAELERIEIDEAALRDAVAREDPVFEAVRMGEVPSLADIRRSLAQDEALLSFMVANRHGRGESFEGGSWLTVVTGEGVRVHALPDRSVLRESVQLFLGLLANRDGSEEKAAEALYEALLADALAEVPDSIARLVVLPDGPLHRLPFGALRARRDGEPLGARYRMSLSPSAALWLRGRRAPSAVSAGAVLAIVGPDAGSLADGETPGDPDAPGSDRSALLAAAARSGPLPHARREVRNAARHLGGRSRSIEGLSATERFLKEADLAPFGVLHLAAHAFSDEDRPERSAVLLAPGADAEDGLLQVREIVDLGLDGRIVVLSGCRSASGALLEGEGVQSLARAFLVAGAPAVVGSLWPLRDDEAAALFDDLYRHLAAGRSLAGALAEARRDRVRAGAPTAAWAGVVLLGDGDLVPLPGGRRGWRLAWWQLSAAAAALAAGAGLGGLLRRRNPACSD